MFRIRRIFDDLLPANRRALDQVRDILRAQFPAVSEAKLDRIPDFLRNPLSAKFRGIVYVAETDRDKVRGCALLSHEPNLGFCYLDYLASDKGLRGRGIGAALYERIREECLALGVTGLFFECLPDDPALCRDQVILKENQARLRFYEGYGARPIINTAYETPVKPGDDNPPYLVFDGLGKDPFLKRELVAAVMATVLEYKYRGVCPPEYVRMVVDSVKDNPVRLRAPRYSRSTAPVSSFGVSDHLLKILLVVTDQHEIHHVRDRGYVESPVRIQAIRGCLMETGLFREVAPVDFGERWLTTLHDPGYVNYFKRICDTLEPGDSVYPYVFPIRNVARPPEELIYRAGYYCIDTFTPLNRNAFVAARRAVDCSLTAAQAIIRGTRLAYALVRPPGHHAERYVFGGFCYFNNGAIAAEYLSRYGTVAVLDIDYHHGNGQQSIFADRSDVLTVSIHGHPRFAYPYFSGYPDERGRGPGAGYNVNIPLPEEVDGPRYLQALDRALAHVRRFGPTYVIVGLGFDTAKGDPTGTWSLRAGDFLEIGRRIASLRRPVLVVQEGGYRTRSLGVNARNFFAGLASSLTPPA